MLTFRFCLLAAIAIGLGCSASLAEVQTVDSEQLLFGTDSDRSRFKTKPAQELMSKREYHAYRQALDSLDYDAAGKLLNSAFIREYPQFKRARLKPDCFKDRDCRYWAMYANSTFLEYGYCWSMLEFQTTQHELSLKNLKPPKFAQKPWPKKTHYSNRWVRRRDGALTVMIGQAELNHTPALIKLASLVRRGDVFHADDEIEYYLLQRACHSGGDCAAISSRMAELSGRIAPERISVIETKAWATPSRRPRLQFLLLGEEL